MLKAFIDIHGSLLIDRGWVNWFMTPGIIVNGRRDRGYNYDYSNVWLLINDSVVGLIIEILR